MHEWNGKCTDRKRERKMRWTDERASEQSASVTVTVTVWMDEWCELLAAYVSIYCIVDPRKSNSVGCCHPVTQSCSQASNHPSNQPTTVASYHIRQSPQCNAELWITQWIWLQQVAAFIFTFHTPHHPEPGSYTSHAIAYMQYLGQTKGNEPKIASHCSVKDHICVIPNPVTTASCAAPHRTVPFVSPSVCLNIVISCKSRLQFMC